jgi:hypothetical protein
MTYPTLSGQRWRADGMDADARLGGLAVDVVGQVTRWRAGHRSSSVSGAMPASMSAKCVNACGKLPSCSPVSPISSE